MQRSALSAIADFYRERPLPPVLPGSLKVVEIGCGTGRFSTYLRDSIKVVTGQPALSRWELSLVDLSPFYLEKARKNHNAYESFNRKLRQGRRRRTGDVETNVKYILGNGEDLPQLSKGSFDIVVCMYCFHEMPEEARRRVAKTMTRLAKKGGLIVFTDSVQIGDRPLLDDSIGAFKDFDEPYYDTYIREDIGGMFADAGAKRMNKYLSSVTKTLSFTK